MVAAKNQTVKHIARIAFGLNALFVALLGLSIGLAHATNSDQLPWLDNSGCALPCWHGITPGVTSFPEALTILQSMPEVEQSSISGRSEEASTWLWFVYRTSDHQVYAEFDGQISAHILSIWFYPVRGGNVLSIRLAELDARFGPPQIISAVSANNSLLHLIYRQPGIEAVIFIPGGMAGRPGCNRLQMSAGLYLGNPLKRNFEDRWHGYTTRFNQTCVHAP